MSLTASQRESYIREAELLIYSLYPKIRHQISFMDLVEPSLGGAQISNQTNKFAAELSVKTEISVRTFLSYFHLGSYCIS